MIQIQKNISLKPYNSFGIDVKARYFVEISLTDELDKLLKKEKDIFLIGGGSNMLLLNDIERLTVHIATKGKEVIHRDTTSVFLKVQAGENWHEFVQWCIENNYGGVENLALIPGNVGTSPIQNIGAYGVEVKDVIESVETIEISSGKKVVFTNEACKFGYRDSIFKNTHKNQFIITNVTFKLTHTQHKINVSYGAIQSYLKSDQTIKAIAEAVITIRTEKLPDPKKIGNSGSFFKNPIVADELFLKLQKQFPNIPNYPIPNNVNSRKLAAGWLIDQCGFKGYRNGDAGVHKKQALVLVNYANATGKEILSVARMIQKAVLDKFGVSLKMEVNIIQ